MRHSSMHRFRLKNCILSVLMLCLQFSAHAAPAIQPADTMKELSRLLSEFVVDVSQRGKFTDPKESKRIERNLKLLNDLTHSIKAFDGDPSTKIISDLLKHETRHTLAEFKRGNRAYAKDLVRGVASYCIACHTRSDIGPKLTTSVSAEVMNSLSISDRIEWLSATRQYDRAIKEIDSFLSDKDSMKNTPFEVERAAQNGLAISIRVNRDADVAKTIVKRLLAQNELPSYLKKDAEVWKTSLESMRMKETADLKSEKLLERAESLITSAYGKQKYLLDRSATIEFVEVTELAHRYLATEKAPSSENTARALYLLASSYEVLRDLNIYSLHDLYFEACIRVAPLAPTAATCLMRLEASWFSAYSSSSETQLPKDISDRLSELKNLVKKPALPPKM